MAQSSSADVGLIGLAVMGQNLALNMADHGFRVAVYNRTRSVMERFVADNPETPGGLVACATLADFAAALEKPRKVIILVKAGPAVDRVISELLEAGIERDDLVVDCGNSLWTDTIRREREYSGRCLFFGSGVSGGELGARFGPSLMPGGQASAWKHLEPIWNSIAAKVDEASGRPSRDRRARKARPGRGALRRLHRGERSRALCQDDPQRHRVRGHAAHLRSLLPPQETAGLEVG